MGNLGPGELPQVCAWFGICPPGFRNPEKVPYPVLKSFFQKKALSSPVDAAKLIRQIRSEFPGLEDRVASLPWGCTIEDVQTIDKEADLGHVVAGLLLSEREDLKQLALQIMEENLPFELNPEQQKLAPPAANPLEKENRRLSRLVESLKNSIRKKEEKWQRELSKLRDEIKQLKKAVKAEAAKAKERVAVLERTLRQEQSLSRDASRALALAERNLGRTQEKLKKLEFENLQLRELNGSHKDTIRDLTEEVDRLNGLLSSPPARPEPAEPEPVKDFEADSVADSAESPGEYPPVVSGILQIPVRSRFGILSAEQGLDLFVSEKILYNIGAKDGDELEGHLVGEYAPGLPQYRYRVVRKQAGPSNQRELLGIVEERSGWIGVRDLHDDELFIPLHAYELPNVSIGDVVTVLFDITHPHNNRILTNHQHMPQEDVVPHRPRRKSGKPSAKSGDSAGGESAAKVEDSQAIEQTLEGLHVLICGAQSNMVTSYEEAIRSRGGTVKVLENQPASLQPLVAKADIIICNIHQISHPFFWVVKGEAVRQKKPLRYPISGGVSAILREAEMYAAGN
ncbi:DUF2325 domain-containing protein [Effusibacillus lacus]|uniref:Uncharacterized protein n=1 Tax=Effusibacillus lacus TaxID=1348429 RepID=A0A292YMA9_9BACL|nr:DUF2325 domain-containing protein [Effusibacillus lacus]TCS71787.1 uncharacterized protein DUF2325 [Effusibacillus lacus]GAX89645.1 hypothetical protein EFBL_1269 [Effusibacillus lacus]